MFAILIGLAVHFLWQGYQDSLQRGRERAEIAAHTVAVHFQWFTEASRQALRRIEDAVVLRPELLLPGTLGDIDDAIGFLPREVHVRLFDANGNQLLSTRPDLGSVDIAGREYFRQLRAGETFVISPQLTDRQTGLRAFVMARRIERAGEFLGAAVIVAPSSIMADFWASLGLGENSTASILLERGMLVARFPPVAEAIDLSRYELFSEHLASANSGSYFAEVSPADGVSRQVGFRRLEGAPLVAVASVATDTVLADFRTRLRRLLLGATPLLLSLVLLAAWVTVLARRDTTRRQELESALAENRLLFREVHHRVKNNLQTVSSVIQLQAMDPSSKRDLRARIAAMAAVHERVYSGERLGEIEADLYLREIVEGVLAGFGRNVQLELSLESVKLDPDQALAVGLIVTELVSNSLKHSFANGEWGRIAIALTTDGEGAARLKVTDSGKGFDPAVPSKGLGLRLIRGFTQQLSGEYQLDGAKGLAFTLVFPLAALSPAQFRGRRDYSELEAAAE